MKAFTVVALSVCAASLSACGSDSSKQGGGAGTSNEAGASAAGTSAAGTSAAGAGAAGASAGAAQGGSAGAPGPASRMPTPMPLINRKAPAFSSEASSDPKSSNDGQPSTAWFPGKLPAWVAYDVSAASAEQRKQVMVAWYAIHAGAYLLSAASAANDQAPLDYTIEINAGPGGGSPPSDGWTNVVTVTDNARNARQHLFDLNGNNWVRMTVTKATDPKGAAFDLDVHSAPDGASDCWLLMGDSITNISTLYAFDDIPALVNQANPARWPSIVPAAIGGTNTVTAQMTIDDNLKYFPGRFVTLNYGTNNHASDFDMEPLIQKVLAAGKVPVIPLVPWSSSAMVQMEAPKINEAIQGLYVSHPEIVHGPDMWTAFMNRADLIPAGDVHPNNDGQAFWRKQWAQAIAQ